MEALSHILDSIAVVSIDSGTDNSKEKLKYDEISRNLKTLRKALFADPLSNDLENPADKEYAIQDETDESRRVYTMEGKRKDLPQLQLAYSEDDGYPELALKLLRANKGFAKSVLQPGLREKGKELRKDGVELGWILPDSPDDKFFKLLFTWESNQNRLAKTDELVRKIDALYKMTPDLVKLIRKA